MHPREQLKRCFRCKHNIQCWQLDEGIDMGASEKMQKWSVDGIIKHVKHLHVDEGASLAGEWMGMMIMTWVATLNKDTVSSSLEYKRNAVYNPLLVICAMANTSNDGWDCPDGFSFEEAIL